MYRTDFEDSIKSFDCDNQLFANKQNTFNHSQNPSAEALPFIRSIRKGKVIRKYSAKASHIYHINKRISEYVRRLNHSPSIEAQVIFLTHKALEQSRLSTKKLQAIVATALYLVYRRNHSQILLSQILEIFAIRSGDISKCLCVFKELELYPSPEALSPWPVYTQLVDHWLPYSPVNSNDSILLFPLEFAIDPSGAAGQPKLMKEDGTRSIREMMLEVGKKLVELSELSLARQGKLPQTFAAGVFAVASKFCKMQIEIKEIAKRLNISASAIRQSKHLILEVLAVKAGAKKEDVGAIKYNQAIELIKKLP